MNREKELLNLINQPLKNGNGTIADRICFLVYANNGWQVHQWGIVTYGNHQTGLEQNEALDLIYWQGYFDGLSNDDFNAYKVFFPFYEKYKSQFGV